MNDNFNSNYTPLTISPDLLQDKTPRVLMIGKPYKGRVIFVGLDFRGRFYLNKDGMIADLIDFHFMESEIELINVVFCPNFLQILIENNVHFNLEIPSNNYPPYNGGPYNNYNPRFNQGFNQNYPNFNHQNYGQYK